MLFPTFAFGLFFVVVFVLSWLTRPRPVVWRVMMLTASGYFYAYWNWRFLFLLAGAIAVNWLAGDQAAAAARRDRQGLARWWVRGAVVTDLVILGVFKYYDFFALELANLARDVGIDLSVRLLSLTLPVGISFFTFQAMSYVIDIGRRQIEPMELLDFAVYLSFFPQLVAGPIVRASEMAPQLATRPDPRYVASAEAFRLIFLGLFKKVVVSSYLASEIVDGVFADPAGHSGIEVLFGIYAYAIQIYADFSGYTDIAIGVALLLGFRFPQNFDAPYRALSIQDFWRRWHITLSNWLRDYLYIPLGGSRGGTVLTYRNLMVTMLLGGLWHGSTWNFVVWGAIHGGAMIIERLVKADRDGFREQSRGGNLLGWIITFHVVCGAWVFFRSETLDGALDVLARLGALTADGAGVVDPLLVAVIVVSLAAQFVPADVLRVADGLMVRAGWLAQGVALGLGLVVIDVLGPDGVAPFIYFQF